MRPFLQAVCVAALFAPLVATPSAATTVTETRGGSSWDGTTIPSDYVQFTFRSLLDFGSPALGDEFALSVNARDVGVDGVPFILFEPAFQAFKDGPIFPIGGVSVVTKDPDATIRLLGTAIANARSALPTSNRVEGQIRLF